MFKNLMIAAEWREQWASAVKEAMVLRGQLSLFFLSLLFNDTVSIEII
jgi:hypothetical protein